MDPEDHSGFVESALARERILRERMEREKKSECEQIIEAGVQEDA